MSADFEPPKYIQSLIGAINDAAKAAQTSALFLLALGLYLVATVISTTDEDLLRGTAVQFAQLGVRTPVAIAYALAPTIFLFLHVHTLIRFDMLAANLRLFGAELARAVPIEADRERCRALLANVEFVQYMAAPRGSSFRSPLFRFMALLIISALPVAVFLAVQISFLRYQSEAITALHQVCLALDLAALSWFHARHWLAGRKRGVIGASAFRLRIALNLAVSLLVLAFALVYAGVPSEERTTIGPLPILALQSEVSDEYERGNAAASAWTALRNFASQPLDLAACPWLGFGCRFLRLDHRTLLANSPPADVLVRLRTGKSDDLEKDLEYVEGLFLRGRALRFADFTESRLYVADLKKADLQGALLEGMQLHGANLEWARLQGANLQRAQLQGADLYHAELQGAALHWAQLQRANLGSARLQDANLSFAELQGATLWEADLQAASLLGARLAGANLQGARLQGARLQAAGLQGSNLEGTKLYSADLWQAYLQGADIREAELQGADLRRAKLQGADLSGAELQGADLRETRLWHTADNGETNLGLADLRGASWQPIDDHEKARLREIIDAFPDRTWLQQANKEDLELLIAPGPQSDEPPYFALDGVLLVDDVADPHWQRLDRARLTTDEGAYDEALVDFLADLARSDADVARGLAFRIARGIGRRLAPRVEGEEPSRAARLAQGLLDRAGPALPEDVRQRLSRIASQPVAKD